MVSVVFYIAALCSIAGAIGVVVSPNPIHSAMFLVMTLMSFAVHYVLLGALGSGATAAGTTGSPCANTPKVVAIIVSAKNNFFMFVFF